MTRLRSHGFAGSLLLVSMMQARRASAAVDSSLVRVARRASAAVESSLIQANTALLGHRRLDALSCPPFSEWPDVDGGVTCQGCTALVLSAPYGYRCDRYCESFGQVCVAAAEEVAENCEVKYTAQCSAPIVGTSDMLCTCSSAPGSPTLPPAIGDCASPCNYNGGQHSCRSRIDWLTRNRGESEADATAQVNAECSGQCSCAASSPAPRPTPPPAPPPPPAALGCESPCNYNGGQHSCRSRIDWLTRSTGESAVSATSRVNRECSGQCECPPPEVAPTAAPGRAGSVKVVSYNLFWWNAFGQNRWTAGESVLRNIRDNLQGGVLGAQECDSPDVVRDNTGYQPASQFRGGQGTFVNYDLFTFSEAGSRDLQARGRWGPRYVTWARVQHRATGRVFWHFNTHWCVHNGNGYTCSADTRYAGSRNMMSVIQEKAGQDPAVITGDFNANINEPGMQHILQNGFSLARSAYVDFIFYSTRHFRVTSSGVGDSAGSDHAPVYAELDFL